MNKVILILVYLTSFIGGMILGLSITESTIEGETIDMQLDPTEPYEYVDSTTCWTALYDDGRAIIHTEQEYLTNDDEGNIVVLIEGE